MLLCTLAGPCDYHRDGGPEDKCPGFCVRCDELATDDEWCAVHGYLVSAGFDVGAIDAAADRAGISVACLVEQAIRHTVQALDVTVDGRDR